MRFHHLVAAAAASLVATIGMAAEAPRQFVHDGHTYVYDIATTDAGKVITGRETGSGEPFRLVVKNGRVTGTLGSAPVAFRVRDAQGAAGAIAAVSN